MSFCEICKISKNTFLIEQLQWLLLRFNSCFQRSQGQNSMRLSPIRSSHRRCSVKKGVLRNFSKFTRKHLCQRLFNSLTLPQMFSFEFCEICKNMFFAELLRMTASVQYILHLAEKGIYCCENPEAAAVGVL